MPTPLAGSWRIARILPAKNTACSTTEVPGDSVLLAGPNRIAMSACGVFYEATRVVVRGGK